MKHYYANVPGLGNVAVSRYAQDRLAEDGISEREFEAVLLRGDSVPRGAGHPLAPEGWHPPRDPSQAGTLPRGFHPFTVREHHLVLWKIRFGTRDSMFSMMATRFRTQGTRRRSLTAAQGR